MHHNGVNINLKDGFLRNLENISFYHSRGMFTNKNTNASKNLTNRY